ncbi:MAG: hypothetical protein PWQ66_1158 [Petrotoga sp.]|nr:hypothetical protein [Petrotoga sp.]
MLLKTVSILVNYNGFNDTVECVKTLLNQTAPLHKIVVVDNDSPGDDFEKLMKIFSGESRVVVLKSPANGGFAYGNNFGIRYAMEHFKPDFFLLINNDTVVDSRFHEEFLRTYEEFKDSKIGIITGKIYYYHEKNKIWFAGGYFPKFRCSGYHFNFDRYDNGKVDKVKEITFATGCLWFVPALVFEKVGLLPEEYFMYLEDTDYCLKLQRHGCKIIYNPKVKIWHKVGASSNHTKETPKYYWMNRNRIILCKKYFGVGQTFIFTFGFLIPTRLVRFLQFLLKGKIVNTFEGILDGLRFNMNKK